MTDNRTIMMNMLSLVQDCFGDAYGASCFGCGQKIGGNELWVEALDHNWHPHCFVCDVRDFTCISLHHISIYTSCNSSIHPFIL